MELLSARSSVSSAARVGHFVAYRRRRRGRSSSGSRVTVDAVPFERFPQLASWREPIAASRLLTANRSAVDRTIQSSALLARRILSVQTSKGALDDTTSGKGPSA